MNNPNQAVNILVIDDDHAMTDLLKLVLEDKNFIVHLSNSGTKGIEQVRKHNFDVIIVDLLMPGKDGFKVCREIRKFSAVPIMVMSVINKPGIVEQALDSGADEYLIKPIPTNVLIARLNTLTRRARAEREAASKKNGNNSHLKPQIQKS